MNYTIVHELTKNQILELVDLYQHEFWSKGRTYEDVAKMIDYSNIVIALIDEDEHLIGFTRVLTDFIYRATVYDVIIKSTCRNQGLGAKLMDAVIYHPQLIIVEQLALYCLPEMIPFYKRWGFTSASEKFEFLYKFN